MATLRFNTNVPLEMRLQRLEGKPVESQFGGLQHMFSADEGNFYVSETVGAILAEQLKKLGIKPGEPIEITKAEVSKGNGRKGIQWTVAKVGFAPGEQPHGAFAFPKEELRSELEQQLARSIAMVEARKQAQQAQNVAPAWAGYLVAQSNALVDAYAAVLKHSARHEGLIKSEDVRSIFLSAFINVSKSNGGRNAV